MSPGLTFSVMSAANKASAEEVNQTSFWIIRLSFYTGFHGSLGQIYVLPAALKQSSNRTWGADGLGRSTEIVDFAEPSSFSIRSAAARNAWQPPLLTLMDTSADGALN
jgi:hypothetical protein